MQSFSEVIDALGGIAAVSEDLGAPYPTVGAWKSRDSIPGEWWQPIVRVADLRGIPITLEILAGIAAKRRAFKSADPFQPNPEAA